MMQRCPPVPVSATRSESRPPIDRAIEVVCVDDHPLVIDGLRAAFAATDRITLVAAFNRTDQLIDAVLDLRPDATLLDIEVPGPDPFEIVARLKQLRPGHPVLLLSGFVRDACVIAAKRAGAAGYLAKADSVGVIRDAVVAVADGRADGFLTSPAVRTRTAGERSRLESLSAREIEVLRLIGRGYDRTHIASELCRSVKTIDGHQDRLLRKLDLKSRSDLLRFAIREGMVEP